MIGDPKLFITAYAIDLNNAGELKTAKDNRDYLETLIRKQYGEQYHLHVGVIHEQHVHHYSIIIYNSLNQQTYVYKIGDYSIFVDLPFLERDEPRNLNCELVTTHD